jgi:cytochrome c-type biogenesis protein
VLAGAAYERMLGAVRWVRRHQAWVMRIGGVMMIAVGVLLITGWWDQAVTWLQIRLVEYNEVAV